MLSFWYFVAYTYIEGSAPNWGKGNAEIRMTKPITHIEQIREIEVWLNHAKGHDFDHSVTNYQLLRSE